MPVLNIAALGWSSFGPFSAALESSVSEYLRASAVRKSRLERVHTEGCDSDFKSKCSCYLWSIRALICLRSAVPLSAGWVSVHRCSPG
ncbi:hypothetical protein FA13DRAFT_629433 [Coprinellus micaceus]|uniref:Uncharacterized protein n=1 Tax=Coprinellus micaceus TaxID=71717 RepID=A0A4Y7SA61_COPMI|nr:hypothetical protein FA13DRAFT_629433 [Coprinellus micaceus]